jgi:hypothetical protein
LILRVSSSAYIHLAAAAPPPPKTQAATATTHFRITTIIIPTASIERCHPHPHYRRHTYPQLRVSFPVPSIKKKNNEKKEGTWG